MRGVLGALNAALVVVYPLAVYFGLVRFSARGLGLLLVALMLPGLVRRVLQRRERLESFGALPLLLVALVATGAVLDDPRLMLAYPTVVNLVLLSQFAWTLRGGMPMVERFARMEVDDLSPAEIVYCRRVTVVWIVFLAVNGLLSAGLAIWGTRGAWALYTGLISYVLIGVLFSIELTVRKYRFRRIGTGWVDRVFARLFPPKEAE